MTTTVVSDNGKDTIMAEKTEPRKFALKVKEIPIFIIDVDGIEKNYTMCELTGKQRALYLNEMNERINVSPDGKAEVKDFEGIQESLLTRCLKDENGELIKLVVLNEYPASTLSDLFDDAQILSGLDIKARKKAKKD